VVERLLSFEARKNQDIERAKQEKQEREILELQKAAVERGGKKEGKQCIERLVEDAKNRSEKMEER